MAFRLKETIIMLGLLIALKCLSEVWWQKPFSNYFLIRLRMSPRYYLFTAILVSVLTLVISWWKQKQTGREIFWIMVKVVSTLAIIAGIILGVAQLLAFLGVAQSGFFLWILRPQISQGSCSLSWVYPFLLYLTLWAWWFTLPWCMKTRKILEKIAALDGCWAWSLEPE